MIRVKSFDTAVGVAATFAASNKSLVAVPGTPLHDLVTKSVISTDLYRNMGGEAGVDSYCVSLWQATDDTKEGPSQHSVALGSYVDDISGFVLAHINYAKTVVKPLVISLAEELSKRSADLKASAPGSDVSIDVRYIPKILQDNSFLDTLNYFKGKAAVDPKKVLKLGSRNNDEIRALMLTGHQRTDEMVVEWLSKLPPNFPMVAWNSFFNLDHSAESAYTGHVKNETPFDRIDFSLAVYLIARKVYDDVQESNMSLAVYRDACIEVRDFSGATLVKNLEQLASMLKNKTLIAAASTYTKKLTVVGEVYNDWLKSGGKPEILLGMLVSNNVSTSVLLIDQKAQDHERAWNTYLMLENTRKNNRYHEDFKTHILASFIRQTVDQDPSEASINTKNSQRLEDITGKVEAYVAGLSNKELDDIHGIALNLVARLRFCHTSSYQILHDIQQAGEANPNVDIREAVLLAAINYLADWLAEQITFKK